MLFENDISLDALPAHQALPGRSVAVKTTNRHHAHHRIIQPPFPEDCQLALFGLGCFWGAEQVFWQLDGVFTTAVGYSGGITPNPTYEEVCSGLTGHNEVVQVVFNRTQIDYTSLLATFWETHNPTQGMRQGNDVRTQYRSSIYTFNTEQKQLAKDSKRSYGEALIAAGHSVITTEVAPAQTFYYAEDYHQQYLSKVPGGYCGLNGTGIPFRKF